MLANDTNRFNFHHIVKTIFPPINNELTNRHEYFKANKVSLNNTKIKYYTGNPSRTNIILGHRVRNGTFRTRNANTKLL